MTISRDYALEHFDEICERAENGEEIVLERPGKTGLALVPRPRPAEGKKTPAEAAEAIRRMMQARKPLEGITIRELIDEGRRY